MKIGEITLCALIVLLITLVYSDCASPLSATETNHYEEMSSQLESIGKIELDECCLEIKIFQRNSEEIDSMLIMQTIKTLNQKCPHRDFRVALYSPQRQFVGGFYQRVCGKVFFTISFDY